MTFEYTVLVFLTGSLLAFASAAVEPPQSAQTPDQQQLKKLLSGNTLDGDWAGRPYRQYFSPSGSTRYREDKGQETSGTWRVNDQGQYCSVWPPSPQEACYDVLVEGSNIYWKSKDDYYLSTLIKGDMF